MFYSHEILTSREGGVATVWLVATLGSRSSSRRINRKAILNVNIQKTCSIIIQPEAPMALRLQSNLLYGVSRVYSQQCGYVLSDAQIFQTHMRSLLKAVRTSELDVNAGKARPDQLVLQDDPAFLPDLALPGLDIDLSALEISTDGSSRRSSLLSPHSQHTSLSSHAGADESMLGLVIPSSYSGGAGDLGGFILSAERVSSAQRNARIGRLLDDDEGFNNDPGFTIDADGNLVEERIAGPDPAPTGGMRLGSDSAASGRVRQELMEGQRAGRFESGAMDLDLMFPQIDDDIILPQAEAFPMIAHQPPAGSRDLGPASGAHQEQESTDSAEAPLRRRRRAPKVLPVDERQELRNADLFQWNTDYIANMEDATAAKMSHRAPFIAKRNAAFWVLGAGIGGVGAGMGSSSLQSPLAMFAGDTVMEALTGVKISTAGHKRGHDDLEDHDSESEVRRTRIRDGDRDQLGREEGMMLEDDGTMMLANDGVEVGRHAPPALEDPSMPWNASSAIGSRHGSIVHGRGFAGSIGGFSVSAGAPSSLLPVGVGPSSVGRRGSRIPSASPLVGRGRQRYSSLDIPPGEDDDELLAGHSISDDQAPDDFQLYGPAAAVDTQTAGQSQWMRATLNQETDNFLEFVQTKIAALPANVSGDEDELSREGPSMSSVSFEQLLPPTQHSKIVAAQALHHLLSLATKSLITVRQDVPYGSIDLSLPAGV